MIDWRDAFKAAGMVILYTTGWGIFGGLIVALGMLGLGDITSSLYQGVNTLQIIISLIVVVLGLLVASLGSLASFFKVFGDLLGEELKFQ